MAITSQALYDQTMSNIAQRRKNIETARDEALAAQKTQYENASKDLNNSLNRALQEAYITKMQSRRSVPQMLAQQGINGGASETTLANINRAYQNSRNTANENFNTNKTTLDTNYGDNMRQLRENYQDRLDALADTENETKMTWAQYLADQVAQAAASSGGGYSSGGGSSSKRVVSNPGYVQQQRKYNGATTNNYAWQNNAGTRKTTVTGMGTRANPTPSSSTSRATVYSWRYK